ncbi:MAG: MG2 domain-containing protein [Acetobacter sp.]|nr:MG2 domain-containing protein [Acetobacter sp.]
MKKSTLAGIFLLTAAMIGGGVWGYKTYFQHQVITKTAIRHANIQFISNPKPYYPPNQQTVDVFFDRNVAAPHALMKSNLADFKISPEIEGQWYFFTQSELTFKPKSSWIPGEEYTVTMPKDIFAEDIQIKKRTFKFKTPDFSVRKKGSDFYEDPRDVRQKSVTASFEFSYPISEDSIKDGVKIKTVGGKKYDFTYTISADKKTLHIISEPVQIGTEEDFADISVPLIKNLYNNIPLKNPELNATVKIPSSSTFFKVKEISSKLIRNEKNEPEQILEIAFSAMPDENSLEGNITLAYCQKNCYDISEKNDKARWVKLDLEKLPNVEGGTSRFFKYHLPSRMAQLRVLVKEGVKSKEGYSLDSIREVISSAEYPREVNISFDGAVIPLQTHKEVAFSSRGVTKLHIKLAKIFEEDLNHLVTQTGGDFATPYFNSYYFNEENIATIYEKDLMLKMENPAELNYSALDLTPYLTGKNGVFLISAYGMDENSIVTSEDKRLIIVTDLGLIVKDNADGSHTLFVANISKGEPVNGAKIEVLGANGLVVLSAKTDKQGKADLPTFDNLKNEKRAIVYKVSYKEDMSFVPVWRSDRILDYSRYNTGGEHINTKQDELKAFLFSDRGIYRPAETAHFGIMTRLENLKPAIGLPLIAKIYTPDWKLVSQKSFMADESGMADISYNIPAGAPLGRYTLSLYKNNGKYDEFVNEIFFNVEEFLPDTMKLNLSLNPSGGKGWNTAEQITLTADLMNLYGTAADAHTVKGYYQMFPAQFKFDEYADYVFSTPSPQVKIVDNVEFNDETTNANGKAEFSINLHKHIRGTYRLTAVVSGLEREGGRGVEKTISTLVSPHSFVVGYKSDTTDNNLSFLSKDSTHSLQLIAIDSDLKQIAVEDLVLKIFTSKETRVLRLLENGTYGYRTDRIKELVSSENFRIDINSSMYTLNTKDAGDYVLVIEEKGGKEIFSTSYSIAGATNENFNTDKLQNLTLSLDKKTYSNGDTIKVQIRAPFNGLGLMTIEQDKVYTFKWFKTDSKSSIQEIELPKGIIGNAYLNVAIARDIKAEEIFDKPLSYAIAPFNISTTKYELPIELSVPESVKPGEELTISYKTSENADIYLWGVNTGILQVSDYKLPSPLHFFIRKKALQVVTRQILDLVLPDTKLALQLAAPGGGDDAEEDNALLKMLNPFARKQNKPAIFWSGLLKATPTTQTFKYIVPETFNGEMKIMAAGMNGSKFGAAEKSVFVRGDFALTPASPLYVAPGDEFEVSTAVSNLVKGSGDNYKIKLFISVTDGLTIIDDAEQILEISENGESSAHFKLKANDKLGAQTITFTAEAIDDANHRAVMSQEMAVRPAVPFATDVMAGMAKRQAKLENFALNLYPYQRTQMVYASASPLILTKGLLQYLGKYPHYCTEQSISKIFPAMVLFFTLPTDEAATYINSKFIYDTYDDVLAKLIDRQKTDGGFTMWSGGYGSSDKFVSLYALEFLTAAKKYGFNVPNGVYDGAIRFAKSVAAREPVNAYDTLPAYAAYVLTEAGEVTTNYLIKTENSLNKKFGNKWLSSLNSIYIAAGYQLLHNSKKAMPLVKHYQTGKNNLDDARYIYIVNKVFGANVSETKLEDIKQLLKPLEEQNFNTISAAYSILALAKIGQNGKTDNIQIEGVAMEQNGFYNKASFTPLVRELTLTSDQPFYYTIEQEGYLAKLPEKALAKGMEIAKSYQAPKGKTLQTLKLGDEVTVLIALKNTSGKDISDVAVVDLLSGGLEIVRDSFKCSSFLLHSEAREDRALMYLHLSNSETVTISYKAKVIANGTYVVPPVFANAMYDPKVLAYSESEKLVID